MSGYEDGAILGEFDNVFQSLALHSPVIFDFLNIFRAGITARVRDESFPTFSSNSFVGK